MGETSASLLALLAAGIWAVASHLIGRLLRDLPPKERPTAAAVNFLRNGVGLLAFLLIWIGVGGALPAGDGFWLLLASGALGFAVGDSLYFAALPRLGVQTAAMVGLLNVPLAVLMGWVWLDQSLPPAALASMGLVLFGVLLVLGRRADGMSPERGRGLLFALLAAVSWSGATIGGHHAIQEVGVMAGASVRLLGALLGGFTCAALLGIVRGRTIRGELRELGRPLLSRTLFWLFLPAVLCASVLNLIPFHLALRELPGGVAALLFSTTPLFTLPLAPLFREEISARMVLGTAVGFAGVAGVVLSVTAGSTPTLSLRPLPAPEVIGARWPDLALDSEGSVGMTYLVPGEPNRLELCRLGEEGWGSPQLLAEGDDWFVNWADFPQLSFEGADPVATWLERRGEGTYAYGVRLRSPGGEHSWLHGDESPTEHGFVSLVPLAGSRAGNSTFAAWLDGRETEGGGPMTLRGRVLGGPEVMLDGRVCDCCQTDAALLPDGRVLVAWRDRSDGEVRDIAWTVGPPSGPFPAPQVLHPDGWTLDGCPVNGPAVAASGSSAAIAWFTLAGGEGRVQVAFTGGATEGFSAPVRVDEGSPLGRVDAAYLGEHLVVVWLERAGLAAVWRARIVGQEGELGSVVSLGTVSGERSDGFLRMVPGPDGLVAAFTDAAEDVLRVVGLTLR